MTPEVPLSKNCLCIELDPDFYYLMQSYAQRSKFLTLHASQVQDVREFAGKQPLDVIFLEADEQMGQVPWNLLYALKADGQTQHIPVIVFSWLAVEDRALANGADAFVQKPVMYVDFLDVLALVGITNPLPDASPERR